MVCMRRSLHFSGGVLEYVWSRRYGLSLGGSHSEDDVTCASLMINRSVQPTITVFIGYSYHSKDGGNSR